jgi:hypothetical protein
MKLLRAAVVASLAMLAIASCKKNDTSPSGQNALVGKWQGQKIEASYALNGQKLHDTTMTISPPDFLILEFRMDSVVIINHRLSMFGDSTASADTSYYLLAAGKLIITSNVQHPEEGQSYTYQLSGNQLKMYGETRDSTSQGVETYGITFYLKKM